MSPLSPTSVEAPVEESGLDAAVARALGRAGLYRLLGLAFGYPTRPVVGELGGLADQVASAPATAAALREPLARFAGAARDADPDALGDEYVFLFDRQVRCAPCEGAYTQAGQMAGKSAALADVAGFYTAFGLQPTGIQADVEDHVAAELEFMSVLALKEAYALARGHEDGLAVTQGAQVAFLTDHLGRWAEAFARAVREATPLPYYAVAAEVLATWVRAEIEALGATPAPLPAAPADGESDEEPFTCPMAEAEPDEGGPEDPVARA